MLGPLPSLHTSSIYMYLPTICVPKVYHSKYKLFMRYMSISSRGSCIHNQVSIIYNHTYNNIHIQSYKYRAICKKKHSYTYHTHIRHPSSPHPSLNSDPVGLSALNTKSLAFRASWSGLSLNIEYPHTCQLCVCIYDVMCVIYMCVNI